VKKGKKKVIARSAGTPTYGGFRRYELDTVADSARRIFLGEGGCSGTVQIRGICICTQCEISKRQKKAQKKANRHFRSLTHSLTRSPVLGKHRLPADAPVVLIGINPVTNPLRRRKVDRLSDIRPHAEPAVIRPRESNDELPRVLQELTNWNARKLQQPRGEHRGDVGEEVRGLLELVVEVPLEYVLKPLRPLLRPRATVPLLRAASVVVVYRVEVVVLVVPAEGAEEAAHVEPGDVDAVEGDFDMAEDGAGGLGDVVEVPPALFVELNEKIKLWELRNGIGN